MSRFLGPRGKRCRRLGVPLSQISCKDGDKDPFQHRPYAPGQHGPTRRAKQSEYGKRLQEKQKLRLFYGTQERQTLRYYVEASRLKGNTGENLLRLLETRLDAVVLRLGFATSIRQARQLVSHGHFLVDGQPVNIPSFHLKTGQLVEVCEKSKKLELFDDALERNRGRRLPNYLERDDDTLSGKLTQQPERSEIPVPVQENLIVEYYSQRA
jgi:small subunit ribosomal protein S4